MKLNNIGFIGQGWIGNSYANNFEKRGYEVIRYGLEPQYKVNKDKIKECDIVFIAVPTPTTKGKFDDSVVDEALSLVGYGKVAVIKSTILPGTTEKFQNKYKDIVVLHSPEFLTEATAQHDADHPSRNVIGYVDEIGERASHSVMRVLPDCPYKAIVPARTAELIKYCNNVWFYTKVIMSNLFYDLSVKLDIDYQLVKEAMGFDPRIGFTHLEPIHKSGRGAGGHCLLPETKIITSNGIRDIIDIGVGDLVLTHNGSLQKVLKLSKREINEDIYVIRCQGLQPFYITQEHPIYSALANRKYNGIKKKKLSNPKISSLKINWNKPSSLSLGDYVAFPDISGNIFEISGKETGDLMRLVGYYLAEGHWERKRVSFSFHLKEEKYHQDVINLVQKIFGVKVSKEIRKEKNTVVLKFNSVAMARMFRGFGLGAENKHIPDEWLFGDRELIEELLRGYFRGDGSFSRKVFTSATISKKLDEQLRFLLYRLGIIANSHHKEARVDKSGQGHKKAYYICVSNLNEAKKVAQIVGYNLDKKVKLNRNTTPRKDGFILRPIRDIDVIKYNGSVYNLEVKNDNSYVGLDGCFHNCFIKDFAAFKSVYDKSGDKLGSQLLKALEDKNIELLQESNKDLNILEQVYDRQ